MDSDLLRRKRIVMTACICFMLITSIAAPFILISGDGYSYLSVAILAALLLTQGIGFLLARANYVDQAGLFVAFTSSLFVHSSVISSDGLNVFLVFGAIPPLFIAGVSAPRWIIPTLLWDLLLLTIVVTFYPGFSLDLPVPENFIPMLYLLQLGLGGVSFFQGRIQTAALEDVRRAQQVAADHSRAKSEFLANMSHELRTPLNAIIGYTQMVLEDEDDPTKQQDLSRVEGSAIHLLRLINTLLDLAKIEAGHLEPTPTTLHLDTLCSGLIETFRPAANHNGTKLVLETPSTSICTDDTFLQQILLNLLSNAVKFTKEGVVTLRVRNHTQEIEFIVEDTGQGMTESELSRIFEPYVQGNASTRATHGGTGLGLAVSRELAAVLGGSLNAHSVHGEGSMFTLRIPHLEPVLAPQ